MDLLVLSFTYDRYTFSESVYYKGLNMFMGFFPKTKKYYVIRMSETDQRVKSINFSKQGTCFEQLIDRLREKYLILKK